MPSTALPPTVVIPAALALLVLPGAAFFAFVTGWYGLAIAGGVVVLVPALVAVFVFAWRSRPPAALDWADYELLDADGELVKVGQP